ncbi:hypothetical protein ACFVMC_16775 [Nocardia sp. NPDC127579]|uniref:hypothetical protein n=1 Tax=Nocardia sp. NPDC127579 TaxID=3345402 RepID=UPI00364563F7
MTMRVSVRTMFWNTVFWFALAYGVKWLLDRFGSDALPRPWTDLGIFAVLFVVVTVLGGLRAHRAARNRVDRIDRLVRAGTYSEAIPLMRHMLRECTDMVGPDAEETLVWEHKLADALSRIGETAEAVSHAARAVRGREVLYGPHSAHTQASRQLYDSLVQREALDPLVDLLGDFLKRDQTESNPEA